LPGSDGAFLACSFWLCDAYRLVGRDADARAMFDRLRGLANDLGLFAEEYDTDHARQLGNFPQAFSHVALVNTVQGLWGWRSAAAQRRAAGERTPVPAVGG
jgi:GH15 family glucan-1,4-alpha-glucosidase